MKHLFLIPIACFCISTTIFSQNVGIGTTTPLNKLDVKGAMVVGNNISGTLTAPANSLMVEDRLFVGEIADTVRQASLNLKPRGGNKRWIELIDNVESNVFLITSLNSGLNFNTTNYGDGALFLTSAGKIGIGTTDPINRLDVEGAVVIGASFSGSQTAPADGLLVQGNVGIGLETPTAKLHVNGNAIIEEKLVINDTAVAASLRINGAIASTSVLITVVGGPQTVNPGNRTFIRINNTNNVAAIITLGDGIADGQVLYIQGNSSGGGGIQFFDNINNNTQLNSNYLMGIEDTLTLIWNQNQTKWIELNRSVN